MPLQAQTPIFRPQRLQEQSENLQVTFLYQDKKGWIWCGTEQGLFRFDGFTCTRVPAPDSLDHAPVTAIGEMSGFLWVGYRSGAITRLPTGAALVPENQDGINQHAPPVMERWMPEEGTPAKPITAFAQSTDGVLWIATYGEGIYGYRNGRMYQFGQSGEGLPSDDIYALATDPMGCVWAATDGGLSCCKFDETGRKKTTNFTTADGLPDEIVTAVTTDGKGNLWIGTYDHGVSRFDLKTKRFDVYSGGWTHGPVTSLTAYGNTEVWAGTAHEGVVRFDAVSGATHVLPNGNNLRTARVKQLLKDREGLLWVLADKGQVFTANVRFGALETPLGQVQAVCSDRQKRLWAGAQSGLYVRENGAFRLVLKENILSLWEAPNGLLWVGTFGKGVFVLDGNGRVKHRITEGPMLNNGSILSIAGNQQLVWLATLGGVTAFDPESFLRSTISDQQTTNNYVYKVLADSKGRFWFGTDGNGLSVWENGVFKQYTEAAGQPLKTIYCIAEDKNGHLWFSTDKTGLFRFDGKTFRHYTRREHLHSTAITGLAVDGNGQVIIAYEDGFDALNPATDHVAFYNSSAGAPSADINLNAMFTDAQGHVWMGGSNGLIRAAAFQETFFHDPQPSITAVSVFMQALDYQKTTRFAHNNNYFIFNFTGLWYTNPDVVRYRYRLEGFDPDWKVSKDHLASYPNLPPGSYVFRLQASEHGSFENTPETVYAFTISHPFWVQWWFIVLCTMLAVAAIYAYIRYREGVLKREAQLKREKIEYQFEALKSQINPHFLFNSFNTLITVIEENPNVAVSYVEHLSDFYRSMLVYRERNLISLNEEMELVRNFHFLLKQRFENNFTLNENLNGAEGRIMPLTLQILVENAVKHNVIAAKRPLTVDIFVENGQYVVVRNNYQPKLKPESGTRFGLQSLVKRYLMLGDKPVEVHQDEHFFTVKIPLL
ncbi:MAG: histidine kinase [Saprospiraceae bacterium]|nr:histidine kinase [Saprospiraceae bacterium]